MPPIGMSTASDLQKSNSKFHSEIETYERGLKGIYPILHELMKLEKQANAAVPDALNKLEEAYENFQAKTHKVLITVSDSVNSAAKAMILEEQQAARRAAKAASGVEEVNNKFGR